VKDGWVHADARPALGWTAAPELGATMIRGKVRDAG